MADNNDDTEDLGQAISTTEAVNRDRSGGYLANGQPAPPKAMVDTQSASVPAQKPLHSLNDIDAAITGAPNASPVPKRVPLPPHQLNMENWDDESKLQAAARAGGFDTDKIPPEYWAYLKSKYGAATDPGVLDGVRHWLLTTKVGQFMSGWDGMREQPSDDIPLSTAEKVTPGLAEMRRADQFFNQNIQTRIIEKGQYISADGRNYTPPPGYQAGVQVRRTIGDPYSTAANVAALDVGGRAVVSGAMSLGAKAAQTASAFAEANPRAAALVGELMKYSALGAMFRMAGKSGQP